MNKNLFDFKKDCRMSSNMLFLAFSVLLIAKVTPGKIDCESDPFDNCEHPKVFEDIPREVSEFNERCVEFKSYLRCAKEYQDECGTEHITFFESPDVFEATYNVVSEVCEDGTLLNLVATENLKCVKETFGKTSCRKEADEFIDLLIKRAKEDEEFNYKLNFFCLDETHFTDCGLRALSENCGKLVEEAALTFILRIHSLGYACSVEEAKSVLNELENLDLSEDKKKSMALLLEKFVEENSD